MNSLSEDSLADNTDVLDKRRTGILLPINALPNSSINADLRNDSRDKHSGDFSQALQFIDFLKDAGCSVWQLLPLGPTHPDNSPYQCLSAHAGNPLFISLDWLCQQGYLSTVTETQKINDKSYYLQQAFKQFSAGTKRPAVYHRFVEQQAHWLEDYALFMAIRQSQHNQHWMLWDEELRDRAAQALASAKIALSKTIEQIKFEQFVFFQQWQKIKAYAQQQHILLFGDMPLFVAHDSAEVWRHREFFMLDKAGRAEIVAGVPPDYFSAQGQRWGNPHYRWDYLQAQQFHWWLQRLSTELSRFDLLRIDHFRGLTACWAIPATANTAAEGYWLPVPGAGLLQKFKYAFTPLPLIAEDLGMISPDVEKLRDQFQLPGMKILQFAFDGGEDNPYLPANHIENCVLYTGTHDNNTSLGWYQSLDEHQSHKVDDLISIYIQDDAINHRANMPWPLIYCALSSMAKLVILPMQDILALGEECRTNTPETIENNWQWQFEWTQITPELSSYLKKLLQFYHRE